MLEMTPSPLHSAARGSVSKFSLTGSESYAQSERDAQQTAATHAKLFISIRILKPFNYILRVSDDSPSDIRQSLPGIQCAVSRLNYSNSPSSVQCQN